MDTDADELIEDAGLEGDPFWGKSCEYFFDVGFVFSWDNSALLRLLNEYAYYCFRQARCCGCCSCGRGRVIQEEICESYSIHCIKTIEVWDNLLTCMQFAPLKHLLTEWFNWFHYRVGVWITSNQSPSQMSAAPLFMVAQVRLTPAPAVAWKMLWTKIKFDPRLSGSHHVSWPTGYVVLRLVSTN